ncbi:MAG: GTPase Era [Alphaproteobacteria bacterium]|nr:GTPase Era [Alphaproteobacteria bacterium]
MSETACAMVAIVGAPNAGKSTLVNLLVGSKVAIVTHKVQTTRFPLRGVAMRGSTQLVLIDTPGVFSPKRRLDRAMVRAAWGAAEDADAVVHLVDAPAHARALEGRPTPSDAKTINDVARITEGLKGAGRAAFLALNKIDAMPRAALLAVAKALHETGAYTEVFMISALTGDGVEALSEALCARAAPGPWLYPEDQAADAPARVLASEITREKLMLRLHDEIPYEASVETEAWVERKDGSVRIEQTIFVARDSQRRIAIGDGGQTVKAIGEAARLEMAAAFDKPVHLFLHVKVREGWAEERSLYTARGLDYDA